MEPLLIHQHQRLAELHDAPHSFSPAIGGHMAYVRTTFRDSNDRHHFVKAHIPSMHSEEWREREMKELLQKEARVYAHLRDNGYPHLPEGTTFDNDMLIMQGLDRGDGWYWRAPKNPETFSAYVSDVLLALKGLESTAHVIRQPKDEVSVDTFYNFGWGTLHDVNVPELVQRNTQRWHEHMRDDDIAVAQHIADIPTLSVRRSELILNAFNHHDSRQANIAWHPEHGVKVVDWSWADSGLRDGDTTMFLLDLAKSGHDISDYMAYLNPTYAKLVLGYWLHRSSTPHPEGHDVVRMHQFISALKAAKLLLAAQKVGNL